MNKQQQELYCGSSYMNSSSNKHCTFLNTQGTFAIITYLYTAFPLIFAWTIKSRLLEMYLFLDPGRGKKRGEVRVRRRDESMAQS